LVQLLEVKDTKDWFQIAASLSQELQENAVARDAQAGLPDYEINRLRESGLLPTQDPYILYHYGELWTELKAAIALADQAAVKVQAAWEKDVNLTFPERGEVAIAVFAAKTFATKVGLNVTNRIFELMGTRSTATKYGFDRYWRDLRTFTLHDPVDYKLKDIGNWVLNKELPTVTQYS